MRILAILLIAFSLVGCSNRAVYENIQINQRNDCVKVPPPEYDACMERANKSYGEYERERREVVE